MRPHLRTSKEKAKPRGDARKILRLAIPISLESVFQMGFNAVDQIIVGLLGADAVAAVGLSNSIASIALLLYASAGVGAGVMVARAFGRKEMAEVSQIASAGQALSGLLGLLSAFLLVAFSQPILGAVGADSKLVEGANIYFQLYSASIAPMILSSVTSAVFRSLNAPKTPLIITSLALAANTLLGFVLVLGVWACSISRRSRRWLGHFSFAKRAVPCTNLVALRRQKRRALGLAGTGLERKWATSQGLAKPCAIPPMSRMPRSYLDPDRWLIPRLRRGANRLCNLLLPLSNFGD